MANSQITETVTNILQQVSDLRGESTINTDALRIRGVTAAEQTFAKRQFWSCHLLRDQTTTGDGTNSYEIGSATYPMRLKGLVETFVDGTGESNRMNLLNFNEYKQWYNSNNSSKMVYEYYDQANDVWKMYLNPAPAVGDTITYSYYYTPPDRTAVGDIVVCPNMDAIVHGTMAYIYESEEETNKMKDSAALTEQVLMELEGLEVIPNIGQAKQMSSGVNPMGIRGLGSY